MCAQYTCAVVQISVFFRWSYFGHLDATKSVDIGLDLGASSDVGKTWSISPTGKNTFTITCI